MEKKIRVGAVSYLNTKPLLWGLTHSRLNQILTLSLDYPSRLVEALNEDEIDIGLVPVAALAEMQEYHIVSNYCIGSVGEVASVGIFSQCPLSDIKKVYLDYQSRTSVMLTKVLFREYWKQEVEFIQAKDESYFEAISGNVAGVIIGDRAMEFRKNVSFFYDLGFEWTSFTGLPFVFAAWISKRELDKEFISEFNKMNKFGLNNLQSVIKELGDVPYDVERYYQENISYNFDDKKREGLKLFLSKIVNII